MKRYIHSVDNPITLKLDISYNIELFGSGQEVAAASYKGFNIPEGELMPSDKHAIINSQEYENYHAFIDSVEGLLRDYYCLHIFYKNESNYDSFYCGCLAKNDDESLIIDFNLNLKVSTHPAHRTNESKQHKKEQEAARSKATKGKPTRPIFISVVVNKETFSSYINAFEEVDRLVENAVEKLNRKKNK